MSAVLALLGAAGLLVARWASSVLVGFFADSRDRVLLDVRLDARVLAFTAVVSPRLRPTLRPGPGAPPHPLERPRAGRRQPTNARSCAAHRAGGLLVALQVGLSLVLLVGAGLMLGTLRRLQTTDVGFPRERLFAVFDVKPGLNGYAGPRARRLLRGVARRLGAIPGVIGRVLPARADRLGLPRRAGSRSWATALPAKGSTSTETS
ncbi:MAG: hypothetical protein U0599_13385 [Vicinamibacteria bacterium]